MIFARAEPRICTGPDCISRGWARSVQTGEQCSQRPPATPGTENAEAHMSASTSGVAPGGIRTGLFSISPTASACEKRAFSPLRREGPHNQPYDPRGRLRFRECPGQLCQSLDDVESRPIGQLPDRGWAAHRRPAALVRSARRTSHCSRSIAADNWHTGHPSERGGNSRWPLSP